MSRMDLLCADPNRQLKGLSESLSPYLETLRQTSYYSNPRYHSSLAWGLLEVSSEDTNHTAVNTQEAIEQSQEKFPTISGLPIGFLNRLESESGKSVRKHGRLRVTEIHVKIGQRLSRFSLGNEQ
jgi:hypothetical protein